MPDLHRSTILIIGLILSLGGAIGALLQAVISAYLAKKPSISKRVDRWPKFEQPLGASSLDAHPIVTDGKSEYKYHNLHHVEVQLSNKSKQDFGDFQFGITLFGDDVALYIESRSPDRHHKVEQLTPTNLSEPKSQIDFNLRPFNRGDYYSLRLLVKTSEEKQAPGKIEISSPLAVRFLDLPTAAEVAEQTARRASIKLGPFKFSLNE